MDHAIGSRRRVCARTQGLDLAREAWPGKDMRFNPLPRMGGDHDRYPGSSIHQNIQTDRIQGLPFHMICRR